MGKKEKNMIEQDNKKINIGIEATPLSGVRGPEGLVATVQKLGELREFTEGSINAIGSLEAEETLVRNIPALESIINGDLKGAGNNNQIGVRVSSLPNEVISQTQEQIDLVLATALSIRTFATAKRLGSHLPVVMPRTKAGFTTLKLIAEEFTKVIQIPNTDLLGSFTETAAVLDLLDKRLKAVGLSDGSVVEAQSIQARDQAQTRLEKSKLVEKSSQIDQIRSVIAQQKMRALRKEPVELPGSHGYSKAEVLANEIIERENLVAEIASARMKAKEATDKAKKTVLDVIARKRAIKRVMALIDQDPLICQELARRQRVSPEELLDADNIKRQAANNIFNGRRVRFPTEEIGIFDSRRLLSEEREKITEALQDPLPFIATLSDDELAAIRNIPRISDEKSVYNLANDRLRDQLAAEVTDQEIIDHLTEVIVGEILTVKVANAIDKSIAEQGFDQNVILKDPSALIQSADAIVNTALKFLTIEEPKVLIERDGVSQTVDVLASPKVITEKTFKLPDGYTPPNREEIIRRITDMGLSFKGKSVPWAVATEPLMLPLSMEKELLRLGDALAISYNTVTSLLKTGTPAQVRMIEQFVRSHIPSYIPADPEDLDQNPIRLMRPDLVISSTQGSDGSWILKGGIAEVETRPAGIFIVPTLMEGYGLDSKGYMEQWANSLKGRPMVVVYPREWKLYKGELDAFSASLEKHGGNSGGVYCLEEMTVNDIRKEILPGSFVYLFGYIDVFARAGVLSKAMEIAKLPDVIVSNPMNYHFETKSSLALFRQKGFQDIIEDQYGSEIVELLNKWLIEGIVLNEQAKQGLDPKDLLRDRKDWILKRAGFSRDATESRGLILPSDKNQDILFEQALRKALSGTDGPWIAQKFMKSSILQSFYRPDNGEIDSFAGATRITPIYLSMEENKALLLGVASTITYGADRSHGGSGEEIREGMSVMSPVVFGDASNFKY